MLKGTLIKGYVGPFPLLSKGNRDGLSSRAPSLASLNKVNFGGKEFHSELQKIHNYSNEF